MKLSEMIAELQRAQRLLGDLDADVVVATLEGRTVPISVEPIPGKDTFVLITVQED